MLFMRNLNIYSLRDLPQNKKKYKTKLTLMNFTKVQIIDTENAKGKPKKKTVHTKYK